MLELENKSRVWCLCDTRSTREKMVEKTKELCVLLCLSCSRDSCILLCLSCSKLDLNLRSLAPKLLFQLNTWLLQAFFLFFWELCTSKFENLKVVKIIPCTSVVLDTYPSS
jgi:hypothetical protein